MTAVSDADVEAVSPNGKYTIEARSPDNGTINHKDGRPPSQVDSEFNYFHRPSEFRYRLIDDTGNGSVLWERWQEHGEDAPQEVFVSDEGWSILRTSGIRLEVLAVSPEGKVVIRVSVVGPKEVDTTQSEADQRHHNGNCPLWCAARMQVTISSRHWTTNSWRQFFQMGSVNYFAWRTYWGQRLVIDLTNAVLVDENARWEALNLAIKEAEIEGVRTLLSDLASHETAIAKVIARRQQDPDSVTRHPLLEKLRRATSAIHLVGVHRVVTCVPFLRRLEQIDWTRYSTGTTAMGDDWWLEGQYFRPILHHTLRLLGEEPQGYATYHFTNEDKRFLVPERVPSRRERANSLNLSLDSQQVLLLLGSPDHVRNESRKAGKSSLWTEDWEYDFRVDEQWVTLRITWEEEDDDKGKIARIEEVASPWLKSDEREEEILSCLGC